MSILQEYESIRSRLKPGEFEAMERYLALHPELFISDIYYNEERYKEFFLWWTEETKEIVVAVINTTPIDWSKWEKYYADQTTVQVYVDGSYNKDNNLTGAGIVIIYKDKVYKKSFVVPTEEDHSWNIDGECHATLKALEICSGEELIEDTKIIAKNININYDYLGIEKWIDGEWKIKSKISRFYSSEFKKIVNRNDLKVTFNKIKSHSGDQYNDIADGLAKDASESKKK